MTDKNPEHIKKMFDSIAENYDLINNIISFNIHKTAKKQAISDIDIPPNSNILDLCTGTGDLAYFLSAKGTVTGVDFSEKMLDIARKKVPNARFILADCTNLPFEDNSFDIITIGFGLRNIENPQIALKEISRVLKPNGKFIHLDFSKTNPIGDIFFDNIIPYLVKIFYADQIPYRYLVKSKQEFLNPEKLAQMFEEQGFKFCSQKYYALNMICSTTMTR